MLPVGSRKKTYLGEQSEDDTYVFYLIGTLELGTAGSVKKKTFQGNKFIFIFIFVFVAATVNFEENDHFVLEGLPIKEGENKT